MITLSPPGDRGSLAEEMRAQKGEVNEDEMDRLISERRLTTLRHDLWNSGFRKGTVVICRSGSMDDWLENAPKRFRGVVPREVADDDPALDLVFDDGFGCPANPPVIAEDADRIYFHTEYDGATAMSALPKTARRGLDPDFVMPFLGG